MVTFKTSTLLLDSAAKYKLQDAAKDSILFNAPRPLWGTNTWQGDFCHGIFYAAVAFNDPQREQMIMDATENDAWVLYFIAEDKAKATLWDEYMTKYPDLSPQVFEDHWRDSYNLLHCHGTIESDQLCANASSPA